MLIQKFEEQVRKTPGHIAVKTAGKIYTYTELNRFANGIAYRLDRAGTGEIAGLLFAHGVNMIAAILGALKAGKIYVPLSVDYPPERLSYMLSDSEASVILTDGASRSLAQTLAGKTNISLLDIDGIDETDGTDEDAPGLPGLSQENPVRTVKRDKPAYILYTSGSTGRPKGVVQTHENVDYFDSNCKRIFSVTPADRMALFASFCHDASVVDLYTGLHSGATLYPFNMRNPETEIELSEFLNREKITIWHSVPSLFSSFANTLNGKEQFPHLRLILLGGEQVREHEVRMLNTYFPAASIANIYGQTESSVNAIHLIPHGGEYKKPLLGTALEGTQLLVIDEEGDPVEPLGIGEILVASPYISPGYWKNPELTAEVFAVDEELGKLYWTGDLGRLLVDGNIEFLGRRDFQVKIRGFRVELGEIESRLLEHHGIAEAIVTLRQDNTGDNYLCAYITAKSKAVPREQADIDPNELRQYLAAVLPDYMVPAFFVFLETMPRTPTGKIDRKALPQPDTRTTGQTFSAPRDEIEIKLLDMWADVLGISLESLSDPGLPPIGIDDNFFLSGGNSLKAVRLVSKIQRGFNARVPLGKLFQTPTIRAIAGYIKAAANDSAGIPAPINAAEKKEYYELSINQERLWYLHQLHQDSVSYNMIYRAELRYPVQVQAVKQALAGLMERHESLRTSIREVDHEHLPRQFIAEADTHLEIPLREIDLSGLEKEKREEEADALYGQAAASRFDLSQGPLFRTLLIKLEQDFYHFVFILHHIISDGWSMEILKTEFAQFYARTGGATTGEPEPLALQYKDFAQWQKQQVLEPAFKEAARRYWHEKLPGLPKLQLPQLSMEFSGDTGDNTKKGAGYMSALDEIAANRCKAQAKERGVTLFNVMFAVYLLWLYRFTRQEDIGCSIIHAGREHDVLQGVVGFFVNSLPFRIQIQPQEPFTQFLDRVQTQVIDAFQYQSYSPETVCEDLRIRYPDINVSFNMLNMSDPEQTSAPPIPDSPHVPDAGEVKFDIEPYIREYKDSIQVYWVYRKTLFESATFEYMAKEYLKLVHYFSTPANREKGFTDFKDSDQQRAFKRN